MLLAARLAGPGVHADHGGVVLARLAGVLDRLQQGAHAIPGGGRPGRVLDDGALPEGVEPVGREQHPVAGKQRERRLGQVDVGDLLTDHRAHEHVGGQIGVGLHVRPHLLHPLDVAAVAVIGVLLQQLAVAQQVEVAVPDAHPPEPAAGEEGGDQGTAHALERGRFLHGGADGVVRSEQGLLEGAGDVLRRVESGERLLEGRGGDVARDVPRGVPAHAVGDDHEGGGVRVLPLAQVGDEEGVFLIVARPVDLIARDLELEFHLAPHLQPELAGLPRDAGAGSGKDSDLLPCRIRRGGGPPTPVEPRARRDCDRLLTLCLAVRSGRRPVPDPRRSRASPRRWPGR